MDLGEKKEYRLKFICCGHVNAGKTSIIKRLVNDIFMTSYKATVGVDFALKVIDVPQQNLRVHLQLWDIAGQETFGSMTNIYYKNAAGALIVFDLCDAKSFAAVEKWKDDIQRHLPGEDFPIILLGNKYDLVEADPSKLATPIEEIEAYAAANKFLTFAQASAKINHNIKEPIQDILLPKALQVMQTQKEAKEQLAGTPIVLTEAATDPEQKNCDCT